MEVLNLVLGSCGMVKKTSRCIVSRVQVRSRLEEEGPVEAQYLGQPESFESCSHGAGRVMSRGEAKRRSLAAQRFGGGRGQGSRVFGWARGVVVR